MRRLRRMAARLTDWLKKTFSRPIVIASILAIVGVLLGILLDTQYGAWFSSNPIISNLIAGLFGLPVAFLIVNLAAERAMAWAERERWTTLRQSEVLDLSGEWNMAQTLLAFRFSTAWLHRTAVDDPLAALGDMWYIIMPCTLPYQSVEPADPDRLQPLLQTIELTRTSYRDPLHRWSEERFRRRALTHFLPRLESAESDPTTVSMVREALEALSGLNSAVIELDANWDKYNTLRELTVRNGFPCGLKLEEAVEIQDYLSAHMEVMVSAREVDRVMNDLVSHLDEWLGRQKGVVSNRTVSAGD